MYVYTYMHLLIVILAILQLSILLLLFIIPTTIIFHLYPFQSRALLLNLGLCVLLSSVASLGISKFLFRKFTSSAERKLLDSNPIDSIYLLAPTSSAARMEAVARMAGGYVYYVSLKGVTGANHLDIDSVAQRIPKIRETVRLPVGVGFGIRDANTAKSVSRVSDAVVIGSRIVEEIENSREDNIERNLYNLLSEIREAIDEC